MQYPTMRRIGASVSPPLMRSAYPAISTNAASVQKIHDRRVAEPDLVPEVPVKSVLAIRWVV